MLLMLNRLYRCHYQQILHHPHQQWLYRGSQQKQTPFQLNNHQRHRLLQYHRRRHRHLRQSNIQHCLAQVLA
jgi:hypothetical protein